MSQLLFSPEIYIPGVLLFFSLFVARVVYFRVYVSQKVGARSSNERSVVLLGPMGGGKTTLFAKLVYGQTISTNTSIKENEGILNKRGEKSSIRLPIRLHDLPGHPRLRTRLWAEYLNVADGLTFVLDASAGLSGKGLRESAEQIHLLFTLLSCFGRRMPILILLSQAQSSGDGLISRAQSSLSRELGRRKNMNSTALPSGASLDTLAAPPTSKQSFFSFLSASGVEQTSVPIEENEIWKQGDGMPFDGPFSWSELESALNVSITWQVLDLDNLDNVWGWFSQL